VCEGNGGGEEWRETGSNSDGSSDGANLTQKKPKQQAMKQW